MEKKMLLTPVFILMLLLSALAVTQLVGLGRANPYSQALHEWVSEGGIPPPNGTIPPRIHILSPKNSTAYNSYNFSLTLKVDPPETKTDNVHFRLSEIRYEGSWRPFNTSIDPTQNSIHIAGVPDGNHTITFYAIGSGFLETGLRYGSPKEFPPKVFHCYLGFTVVGSSIVTFTVDTVCPKVLILSYENRTYSTPDVPLNLEINEKASLITYSLDGQGNVTVEGNTTLRGLTEGTHNITVYVKDNAGNFGASETLHFRIEPFPTTMVIAPIASVIVVGLVLAIYFKKRKR